jgi:hypothetical protein
MDHEIQYGVFHNNFTLLDGTSEKITPCAHLLCYHVGMYTVSGFDGGILGEHVVCARSRALGCADCLDVWCRLGGLHDDVGQKHLLEHVYSYSYTHASHA